jgi:hypothetical protein
MNDVALYISMSSGALIIGLFVLVATGKITAKTYYTIAYSAITVVLALATLFSFGFAALYFIDAVFRKRFGCPVWSILVMLCFTIVAGAATRWAAILLKSIRDAQPSGENMYLPSSQALYDYLLRLAQDLEFRGQAALCELAVSASKQAASSSTEFLGESRIALRRILREEKGTLSQLERAEIEDVLRQITAAINRWPRRE